MSPLLLIALLSTTPGQAPSVSVKSAHSRLAVDGENYRWLRPGKPMQVQVTRKKGQELHVDVVRLGPPSAKQGDAEVVVRVGRKSEKVRVRPPLEESRQVDGSTKLASYPVRHRFDLPFTTNAVRLTVIGGGAEGVGIRVSVGKRKRSRLALAPLGSGNPKAKRGKPPATKKVEKRDKKAEKKSRRRRRRSRKSKKPKVVKADDQKAAAELAKAQAAKDAAEKKAAEEKAAKNAAAAAAANKRAEEKKAAKAKEEAAAAKAAAAAAAEKEAAEKKKETAVVDNSQEPAGTEESKPGETEAAPTTGTEETPVGGQTTPETTEGTTTGGERTGSDGVERDPPTVGMSATASPPPVPPQTTELVVEPERPGADDTLGFRFHVGAGAGALTVGSALFPLGLHVGGRLLGGVNQGWLSRYEFGIGFDYDSESVVVAAEGLPIGVDWSADTVRLRAEMAAKVFEMNFDLDDVQLPVDLAVVLGAGALIGRHQFLIGKRTENRFAFGPTGRVGVQGAVGIGPGAVTVMIPVDASWDVTSGVSGYVPVVGSIFVGYRMSL